MESHNYMVFNSIFFTDIHLSALNTTSSPLIPSHLCHSFIHSFFHGISSGFLREKPKNGL